MAKLKRITAFCLSLCLFVVAVLPGFEAKAAYSPDFEVYSESAMLIDMDTKKVIFEKNADKQLYPASITKIMTCLLVLENIPQDQLETTVITAKTYIFDQLYGLGASNVDIRHNEEVRVIDLLYALMMRSACEAADMLADYIGDGSIDNFVQMMNDKAQELGATKTVFRNAHGLHHPDQVTTARDVWTILNYAIENYPLFLTIATEDRYTMPATNKHSKPRTISHTNTMMYKGTYYYPYIKGIKTGTTSEAGKNLVSMATHDSYNYLLITLHAPVKYENGDPISDNLSYLDHKNIYNWVFDNFSNQPVVKKDASAAQVNIRLGKDKDVLLLAPEKDVIALLPNHVDISSVQKIPDVPKEISAPVAKGQVVGKLTLKSADEVIGEVNLVATEAVERSTFLYILDSVKKFFTSFWFKLALIIIVVFLVLYVTLIVMYNRKKKKSKRVKPKRYF